MITDYNSLPLGTYLEIDEVLRSDSDEFDRQARILAILSGKTFDDILALPLDEYASMAAQSAFLRVPCPPATAPDRVIVSGLVLIPEKNFTKITAAQYIDFQTFSKGGTAKLPELLSALLIPEGCKYNDGYDPAEVVEAVRTLPLPVAIGLAAFFFARLSESIADSLTSLTGALKTMSPTKKAETEALLTQVRKSLAGVGLHV